MSRGYRSRSSWSSGSSYGSGWPTVVAAPLPNYRSIFEPLQVVTYGPLQPNDLKCIQRIGGVSVIRDLAARNELPNPQPPRLDGSFPVSPTVPNDPPPSAARPVWEDFKPQETSKGGILGFLDSRFGKAAMRRFEAQSRHNVAVQNWQKNRHALERAEKNHNDGVARFEAAAARHAEQRLLLEGQLKAERNRYETWQREYASLREHELGELQALMAEAATGSHLGVIGLASKVLNAIPLPKGLPLSAEAEYDKDEGILLYTVLLPNMEEVELGVALKTKTRPATDREIRTAQEYVLHAIPLRLMHEIFATPEFAHVAMVGANLRLQFTDRHNGKRMDEIVASVAATREEFATINVAEVEPKLCFKALKGVATPSFQDLSPIRPILTFDRNDKRIVEGREVLDKLHQEENLAAMDWEDFEHVVRELFAKMFTARSAAAEVHVTRASRDYGVDALIHDPDPIHGGKFVIQAKRYVNTVDVAAVRDLFGTVQNEGANRGYLVTTSSFGPDAHSFAKGKPLTLVDGTHLLQLLRDYGYSFRINLAEARQQLHGR